MSYRPSLPWKRLFTNEMVLLSCIQLVTHWIHLLFYQRFEPLWMRYRSRCLWINITMAGYTKDAMEKSKNRLRDDSNSILGTVGRLVMTACCLGPCMRCSWMKVSLMVNHVNSFCLNHLLLLLLPTASYLGHLAEFIVCHYCDTLSFLRLPKLSLDYIHL